MEEYCWATTQAAGRSCCGRSRFGVLGVPTGLSRDRERERECVCVCVCVCTYIYRVIGLFEMIVGILTTCHTQYT
jgi:hypothetical protein